MRSRLASLSLRVVVGVAVAAVVLWAPSVAGADWAPVAPTQLSSSGSFVLGVSAASVGGVPYVAWDEGAQSGAVSGPVHVAALNGSTFAAVGGAVGSCNMDPVMAAVGANAYVACRASGGVGIEVYSWNGSAWVQVGAAISSVSTSSGAGLAAVGGTPYVAFATQSGQVEVESLSSGGSWTQVGATLIGTPGGIAATPSLLTDGNTPIVAWTESDTVSGNQQERVYAQQLQGASWTPLNSGAPIYVTSSGAPQAMLDGLTMIGSTPYLALDEFGTTGASYGYALALAGSSFQPAGGPIVTNALGYFPQVALGTLAGAPLAVAAHQDADDNVSLVASKFASGAWSAVGDTLGVPPLPSSSFTPYAGAALASDQAGTPYVFFLQGTNNGTQESLFVEAYTAAGTNPNTPFDGNPNPPTVTIGTPLPPAAYIEFASVARFRHGSKRVTLNSGLTVSCPAATGHKPCRGSAALQLRARHASARSAVKLTRTFSIAAGRTQTLTISISHAKLKALRKRGPQIIGTLKISVTGSNGEPTVISEPVSASLP